MDVDFWPVSIWSKEVHPAFEASPGDKKMMGTNDVSNSNGAPYFGREVNPPKKGVYRCVLGCSRKVYKYKCIHIYASMAKDIELNRILTGLKL